MDIFVCEIQKIKVLVIFLKKESKMGTIGVQEGEMITLAIERATKQRLPIIAVVSSAGIRIQEGTLALMQMSKIVGAIKKHGDKGLLYIAVILHDVYGGTSASVVALADIIIAEKGSKYGFAGRRIIEDTTNENLPDDFQTAKFAKKNGMIDIIVDESEIENTIARLLYFHKNRR